MSCISAPIRIIIAFIALVALTAPAIAQTNSAPVKSEIILLKNGDRVTGVVLKEDEKSVSLKTRWNAELVLPKSEIEKREQKTPQPVVQAEASVPVPVVPAKEESLEKPATKPKPAGIWKGKFQLGADLRESTVSSYLYSAVARVSYTRGDWNTAADYRYSYGRSGKVRSADRMDGTLKTDLNLGEKKDWFVYGLGGVGYDQVRKIDFQFELGPGFGRHLLVRKDMALNGELGMTYQQQDFSNGNRRDEMRVRFAEDYFWQLNPKVRFEHKAEIQPAFDDPGDYRVRLEATVSYALFSNLSWNVSLIDLYDSEPTPGVSKNDLQVRSGLGFSF